MIRPEDLGALLADVVAAIERLTSEERAQVVAVEKTRTQVADACRVLHRLHAGVELEEAPDAAARGARVVTETSLSGRPRKTVRAESVEAASQWDPRGWTR